MIAFAGFQVTATRGGPPTQGVLKVAAVTHSDGNGYLTLTFVLDLEADADRAVALRARFARADHAHLAPRLGPDFEALIELPLNSFAESEQFYIEELNLYFRGLAGRERALLGDPVIPVLADLLAFTFEPLEWVGQGGCGALPPSVDVGCDAAGLSLKERLIGRVGQERSVPRSCRI